MTRIVHCAMLLFRWELTSKLTTDAGSFSNILSRTEGWRRQLWYSLSIVLLLYCWDLNILLSILGSTQRVRMLPPNIWWISRLLFGHILHLTGFSCCYCFAGQQICVSPKPWHGIFKQWTHCGNTSCQEQACRLCGQREPSGRHLTLLVIITSRTFKWNFTKF